MLNKFLQYERECLAQMEKHGLKPEEGKIISNGELYMYKVKRYGKTENALYIATRDPFFINDDSLHCTYGLVTSVERFKFFRFDVLA